MGQFQSAFNDLLRTFGAIVIVYNDWNTVDQSQFESKAIKGGKHDTRPDFRFQERVDIRVGSVIQIKGGNDLWRVVDTQDRFVGSEFYCFEASVLKIDQQGKALRPSRDATVVFHGPVTGGVQVGGSHNLQTVTVNQQFNESINRLREAIEGSSELTTYQKEDAIEALCKLPALAKEEPSEGVIKRAREKLELVKSVISIGKDLAIVAMPYLEAIAKHW
jgi:hypothetical protein